jgi:hypothetical protein
MLQPGSIRPVFPIKLTRPVGPDMMLNPGNEHARQLIAGSGDVAERLKAAVC